LGRLGESADFAHELQCGSADFVVSNGRLEVEQNFDISTHS
jgi:hypothetical protein